MLIPTPLQGSWLPMSSSATCRPRSTPKSAHQVIDGSLSKAPYLSRTERWYAKDLPSESAVIDRSFCQAEAEDPIRSFRYSNSGLPVLNLDVGYSAFLASGPAIEVIAKIIGSGKPGGAGGGGRGGYMGGVQQRGELYQMSERDVAIAKSKLRGAKVSPSSYLGRFQSSGKES